MVSGTTPPSCWRRCRGGLALTSDLARFSCGRKGRVAQPGESTTLIMWGSWVRIPPLLYKRGVERNSRRLFSTSLFGRHVRVEHIHRNQPLPIRLPPSNHDVLPVIRRRGFSARRRDRERIRTAHIREIASAVDLDRGERELGHRREVLEPRTNCRASLDLALAWRHED